jgi:hypothetical protein
MEAQTEALKLADEYSKEESQAALDYYKKAKAAAAEAASK